MGNIPETASDSLFIALGWDANKEQGYGEAYKDVIGKGLFCLDFR
jgi:hypothetical protein